MTKEQLLDLRDRLYLHDEIPEDALDDDEPAVLPAGRRTRSSTST